VLCIITSNKSCAQCVALAAALSSLLQLALNRTLLTRLYADIEVTTSTPCLIMAMLAYCLPRLYDVKPADLTQCGGASSNPAMPREMHEDLQTAVMLTWHQALFTRTNNRASMVNCAEADDGTMGPGMRVWMCMGLIGQSICSKGFGEA